MRHREQGQTVTLHPTDRCLVLTAGHRHSLQVDYVGLSEWPHLCKQADLGNVTTTLTDEQMLSASHRSGGYLMLSKGQLWIYGGRDPDRDRELRRLSSYTWENAPVTRLRDLEATVRICRVHRVQVPQHLPDSETLHNVILWCDQLTRRLREQRHWLPKVTSDAFQQMILNLWMTSAPAEHLHLAALTLIDTLTERDYSPVFAGLNRDTSDALSQQLLNDLGLTWHPQPAPPRPAEQAR